MKAGKNKMAKNDRFADIAAGYKTEADRGLVSIVPDPLPDIKINLEKGDKNAFTPFKKMDTKEELYNELSKLREYYKPYLSDVAPKINELCTRTEITDFMFSLDGDIEKALKIPYYSGPTGKHTAAYKSEFEVAFSSDKAVFICFKGVDYIAEVFVNWEGKS